MKQKPVQPVLIRVEKEKYLRVRHELLDRGVTMNAFVNRLIDKHLARRSERTLEAKIEGFQAVNDQ